MAFQWRDDGRTPDEQIVIGNDPVGAGIRAASTGSPWPAFMNAWCELNPGLQVLIVPTAVGSSAQCDATALGSPAIGPPGGSWDVGGTLCRESIDATSAAVSALKRRGCRVLYGGLLWGLGESDAFALQAKTSHGGVTVSPALYRSAFENALARFRSWPIAEVVFPEMPCWLSLIGLPLNRDDTYFGQIRKQQIAVAAADPFTHIAFAEARNFVTRGLMNTAHSPHYSQQGYNELGEAVARSVSPALRKATVI